MNFVPPLVMPPIKTTAAAVFVAVEAVVFNNKRCPHKIIYDPGAQEEETNTNVTLRERETINKKKNKNISEQRKKKKIIFYYSNIYLIKIFGIF